MELVEANVQGARYYAICSIYGVTREAFRTIMADNCWRRKLTIMTLLMVPVTVAAGWCARLITVTPAASVLLNYLY